MMATINASIPIPHGMTAQELMDQLSGFPPESRVDVYISRGDRPWESDSKAVKLSYDTTVPAGQAFRADVVPCPACNAVFTVIEGKPQGSVTFFMRGHQRCMSVHEEGCEYKGRETPTFSDWAAAESFKNFGVHND